MHVNSFKQLRCPCIIIYIFDFAYTTTFYFTIILDPFCKQEGELRLRDRLTEPARRSEPAPQSCVFPARTNPIVSQFGHVPELDQPRLGPLSNWQVAPKASLWSYLECPFLVLDACKEPSVIVILVL